MGRFRIAITGAGPVGLEAGLLARLHGHDVVIFERGEVAANLREWGHVRLFSPFSMNSSIWGRAALEDQNLPAHESMQTGHEFAERYLLPLSRHPLLAGCLREYSRVVSIGREGLWKGDWIGKPSRADVPFRLLIESTTDGSQSICHADVVLDCSGTWLTPRWLGMGGIPAIGETQFKDRIDRHLPDISGADRLRFQGRHTLVVGGGYSAATAVVELAELANDAPDTRITWVTRNTGIQPLTSIADDALPGRSMLTEAANRLAAEPGRGVEWRSGYAVTRMEPAQGAAFSVTIQSLFNTASGTGQETIIVDHVLSLVGYQPDRTLSRELQIHECYATQGPIRLAAALLGETSGDCMQQSAKGIETLVNPEPNYFILGASSYGRDVRFLLQAGHAQIHAVLSLLETEPS